MIIHELIRKARKEAGMTQQQLAARMGSSQPHVARLEQGRHMSIKSLNEVAAALGKEVDIRLV